jgi:NAD(P)-dependent dehydrogenase (short-subunit alcohol dehydrogenase family)
VIQTDPAFRLDGKTALVTGAARGIGQAIALDLASAGASVVLVDIDAAGATRTATTIQDNGGQALPIQIDVKNACEVQAAVGQAIDCFGSVDVLVANAGVNVRKSLLELSDVELRHVVETNLYGVLHCARAVGPVMVRAGSGRIVSTCSVSAVHGSVTRVAYCATKGAIAAFTRALAMEWAAYGITVNAVGPGIIETPLLADYLADNPAKLERALEEIPLRRLGQPADVVGAVRFLSCPASSYVTGQVVYVDGGLLAGDTWW